MSTDDIYNHSDIEPKWREYWAAQHLHEARDDDPRPKYYCLDMFPYPSGSGLHVGHWRSYVLPDCWSRYKWLQGFADIISRSHNPRSENGNEGRK